MIKFSLVLGGPPHDGQEWRNWQTRNIQGVVGANPWGFKSLLLHYFSFNGYFSGFPI